MKKIIVILLVISLLASVPTAFAVTQEDFDLAVSERDALYKQLIEAGIDPNIEITDFDNRDQEKEWKSLLKTAFKDGDVDAFVSFLDDGAPEDLAYSIITKACSSLDYNAFKFMDALIEELSDGDLMDQLQAYADTNGKTRSKAFLNGVWEWPDRGDVMSQITVNMDADDSKCNAILSKVGTALSWYVYQNGEIYWWDFEFEDDSTIRVQHRTRSTNGVPSVQTAVIVIYENANTLSVQFDTYDVLDRGRTWIKISE